MLKSRWLVGDRIYLACRGLFVDHSVWARFIVLVVATLSCPRPIFASPGSLKIFVEPPDLIEVLSESNLWSIYIDGVIEPGAEDLVARAFDQIPKSPAKVYLNSPGGDFLTGVRIGRLLRSKSARTFVGRRPSAGQFPRIGECYSACAIAYLGGRYRFEMRGSKYGVHRLWKNGPSAETDLDTGQMSTAVVAAYIREMGVDGRLLDVMVSRGKDDLYVLSEDEQRELRVANNGRDPAEWSLQLNQGVYYLRGVQDTIYGLGKFILACSEKGLEFLSIYEAGPVRSKSIVKDEWFHSLLIDGGDVALGTPSHLVNIDANLNAIFILNSEQVKKILDARESVGHAMQVSQESPMFVGYRVDYNADTATLVRKFVSACPPSK